MRMKWKTAVSAVLFMGWLLCGAGPAQAEMSDQEKCIRHIRTLDPEAAKSKVGWYAVYLENICDHSVTLENGCKLYGGYDLRDVAGKEILIHANSRVGTACKKEDR